VSETPERFYDELADLYHLIFDDWSASIERQGQALSNLIRSRWPHAASVADVACGIGTQALGLAARGFQIEASDIAERAVERANREASQRGLTIHARVDDMRQLNSHGDASADVVIACDNAVPHLLTDDEILLAFRQFYRVTRPGGGCIISVRDYSRVQRSGRHFVPYGVRSFGAEAVSLFQVWEFEGEHYRLNFFFVFDDGDRVRARVFRARYYAVTIDVLSTLMETAGFIGVHRIDDVLFQPVIVGTRPMGLLGC
jgi:2-polyprenyl-3-methyl-5-hydroxy-6-metoxy-1,4-benzoquinol methylase